MMTSSSKCGSGHGARPLVLILFATCSAFLWAAPLVAQPTAEAQKLVVNILAWRTEKSRYPTVGSGIVVARDQHWVYIATATHVLQPALDNTGKRLTGIVGVAFVSDSLPKNPKPHGLRKAALIKSIPDSVLDLSVIRAPGSDIGHIELHRQGLAREGDNVYPVGCAFERVGCWDVPPLPDKVAPRSDSLIRYQTGVTEKGHSGGALFNRWGEVVGMITHQDRPYGIALSIEHVLKEIRSWNYGLAQLHEARVPRAGNRWSLGLSYLYALGEDPITRSDGEAFFPELDRRPPSIRLTVSQRLLVSKRFMIAGHVAALRLAPDNLAIGGGFIGLQANLRLSRIELGLFGEVGLARIESQYDGGGFFVSEGGVDRYEPFWIQVEDDKAGAGLGANLTATLSHLITLNATAGHWAFSLPDRSQGIPDLFVGLGINFGF